MLDYLCVVVQVLGNVPARREVTELEDGELPVGDAEKRVGQPKIPDHLSPPMAKVDLYGGVDLEE